MQDTRRKAYLEAMGIDLWVDVRAGSQQLKAASGAGLESQPGLVEPRVADAVVAAGDHEPPLADAGAALSLPPVATPPAQPWDELQHAVTACRKCPLEQTRSRVVFGVGNRQADLMIIGEAPGADEDREGEPFVGRAGQLLNRMLLAIGLTREQVYIANILKCHPPGNRHPRKGEVVACQDYLDRQIKLVKPQVILSVGGVSAQNLLRTDEPVGRLRRQSLCYGDIPVAVTYHPAYLLRRPEEKARVWQDLQQLYQRLQV